MEATMPDFSAPEKHRRQNMLARIPALVTLTLLMTACQPAPYVSAQSSFPRASTKNGALPRSMPGCLKHPNEVLKQFRLILDLYFLLVGHQPP